MTWPPPAIEEPVWDQSVSLDESDFDEVIDIHVDVDWGAFGAAERDAEPDADADLAATREAPIYEPVDPSALYYMVAPGVEPGEIVLRALAPSEPPPFGVPLVKLEPSCLIDARRVGNMLRL